MAAPHRPAKGTGNSHCLADLLMMRKGGMDPAQILTTLRSNAKAGLYPNLNGEWMKENIRIYKLEGE